MSSTNTTEVLALSLLPLDEAKGIQIGQYVLAGTTGALVWDLLTHVPYDFRLLTKNKIRLTTLVYFASRAVTLANVLGCTIFLTAPVKHCEALQLFDSITYALAVSLTSLLFFFRIRAVFAHNNLIFIFFILWLSVVATSITSVFGFEAQNIPDTPYCIDSFRIFASSTVFTNFVHDTLVFVAITSRLVMYSYVDVDTDAGLEMRREGKRKGRGDVWRRKWKWVFGRRNLPTMTITKTVLEDGQILRIRIAVCANTVVLAMFFAKNLSPTCRTILAETNVSVTNSVACYVYRHTRDVVNNPPNRTTVRTMSSIRFSVGNRHYRAGSGSEMGTGRGVGSGTGSIAVPLQVRVRAPQSNSHEQPTISITDDFDRKDDNKHTRGDGMSAMENVNSILIRKTVDIDIDIGYGKDSSSIESLENSHKYRAKG